MQAPIIGTKPILKMTENETCVFFFVVLDLIHLNLSKLLCVFLYDRKWKKKKKKNMYWADRLSKHANIFSFQNLQPLSLCQGLMMELYSWLLQI